MDCDHFSTEDTRLIFISQTTPNHSIAALLDDVTIQTYTGCCVD